MRSTLVGYAGGYSSEPTYRSMGDHSETLWLRFDPQETSFAALLEIFWKAHNPLQPRYSRQYRSAVFVQDQNQDQIAREVKAWLEAERGHLLYTDIEPAGEFTPAEDYHQKYYLQRRDDLMAILRKIYPDHQELFRSTLASRLNAVIGGDAGMAQVQEAFELDNTPAEARGRIESALRTGVVR